MCIDMYMPQASSPRQGGREVHSRRLRGLAATKALRPKTAQAKKRLATRCESKERLGHAVHRSGPSKENQQVNEVCDHA